MVSVRVITMAVIPGGKQDRGRKAQIRAGKKHKGIGDPKCQILVAERNVLWGLMSCKDAVQQREKSW